MKMSANKPQQRNSVDSFEEKYSPHSSNSSLNELTRITINRVNDVADAGIHRNINYLDDLVVTQSPRIHSGKQTPKRSSVGSEESQRWKRNCEQFLKEMSQTCLRDKNSANPKRFSEKLKDAFLCPPAGITANSLLFILLIASLWGVLWSMGGSAAEPGGYLFALLVVWIAAVLGGKTVELARLPPLLGMLIVGFMLQNVPYIDVAKNLNRSVSSTIRAIALVVILIRAGLGLDPAALKRLSCVCVRLAFLPCLSECLTVACLSHFLLHFPWLWGLMLGFVLAAVSPAVVVPCLLSIQEKGLGVAKGIPTLVIASASIDDVLAIGGFGVVLGITFSTGDLLMTIFQGPIEVLIGLVYGTIIGLLLWFLPERENLHVAMFRSAVLFSTSIFAVLGSRVLDFAGSGPLACLLTAFVAAFRWRLEKPSTLENISSHFSFLWTIFQPFLFGLIGAEISIATIELNTAAVGLGILAIGLIVRIAVSSLAVLGVGFTWKERLFIALAWLPKATVQAAIGPIALDYARSKGSDDLSEVFGSQILTLAVLAIMITAPLGAAAIVIFGPKLLTVDEPQMDTSGAAAISGSNSLHSHL